MRKPILLFLIISNIMGIINSCSTIPKGVTPVQNFNQQKYLGQWYEIARMDFRFERNLSDVTAIYSLNTDGSIKVNNQGFDTIKRKWKQALGKAKFVSSSQIGMLKVSFFGPFYAGYNVVAIDSEYQYALVIGNKPAYMWILSRRTSIPEDIKNNFLKLAKEAGCNISLLVWTQHTNPKTR
jgi:apolipoprotein D and lipocalin family protein